ncbi:universal stress protein [Jatrophihabitans sp.]|jgi:nucleotide-binding universal stress UspA family protein|uniref:universal stress protein n=1 Tax=Jatrophihabitans sp. TaxID=1932789 RepID=UPI002F160ED0
MTMPPVVVGVDDSPDARSAVLWAVQEAALAQTSLLVIHSPQLPPATVPAGHLSTALRACDDVGSSVVDAAIALARANQPGVTVKGLLSHADPAQALIDVSAEAQLLVLGSRSATMGEMSLLSSKRVTVSAHSHCPVLLLGPVSTFSPPSLVERVVVGAANTRAGRAAVTFAAAEAVRRNANLQLLRIEAPSLRLEARSSPTVALADTEAPSRRAEDELAAEGAEIRRRHPGLAVVTDIVRGEAAEILPSYSDSSTILVVGCHHSDDHWSTRLGPAATSVVHRNRGAVVVIGYAHNPSSGRQQYRRPVGSDRLSTDPVDPVRPYLRAWSPAATGSG